MFHPLNKLLSATAVFSIRTNWCEYGSAMPLNKAVTEKTADRERNRDRMEQNDFRKWDYFVTERGTAII